MAIAIYCNTTKVKMSAIVYICSVLLVGLIVLAATCVIRAPVRLPRKASLSNSPDSLVKIKMSSLSFLSAATRLGFDFDNFYNDFTNEGHMYPMHGVGDYDTLSSILNKVRKSAEGKPFHLTDLDISIQTIDSALTYANSFVDFHAIPTKHLDGSARLPDGTRVEHRIPYLHAGANTWFGRDGIMELDFTSGMARFKSKHNPFGFDTKKEFSTTLASARNTPYLKQNENLALVFYADGKQARVNNGGVITNYRYVVPAAYNTSLTWFVSQAYVPCEKSHPSAEQLNTTADNVVWARPRLSEETEDLSAISYNTNRIMKTVSSGVVIDNTSVKAESFDQRYGNKYIDLGGMLLRTGVVDTMGVMNGYDFTDVDNLYREWGKKDLQIAFNEMVHAAHTAMQKDAPPPYIKLDDKSTVFQSWEAFRSTYLNSDITNMSPDALNARSQMRKTYLPGLIGETGWMVVDSGGELTVPDDDGEYFVGWVIDTQPNSVFSKSISNEKLQWLRSNNYALHQGPGILMQTGTDWAHHGSQEPYILAENYKPEIMENEKETDFAQRKHAGLPTVHWRLDSPSVVNKSPRVGAVVETNVGAAQRMLLSVGSKTAIDIPSRSSNFLGKLEQHLLSLSPNEFRIAVDGVNSSDAPYRIIL